MYRLIGNVNELRFVVTEEETYMEGDGSQEDISLAFTRLVFDWEAKAIPEDFPVLPKGVYYLDRAGQYYTVGPTGDKVVVPDGPAEVRLVQVPTQ